MQVILVDRQDCPIGEADKLIAHKQALLHRAFSLMIYRKKHQMVEFLLQKRHTDKYHSAGLWTNTCCSHPIPGELLEDSVLRRVLEELGIVSDQIINLKKQGQFYYHAPVGCDLIEHEIDHVFSATLKNPDISFAFNQQEILEIQWIESQKLVLELKKNPERYTIWLPQVLNFLL